MTVLRRLLIIYGWYLPSKISLLLTMLIKADAPAVTNSADHILSGKSAILSAKQNPICARNRKKMFQKWE